MVFKWVDMYLQEVGKSLLKLLDPLFIQMKFVVLFRSGCPFHAAIGIVPALIAKLPGQGNGKGSICVTVAVMMLPSSTRSIDQVFLPDEGQALVHFHIRAGW